MGASLHHSPWLTHISSQGSLTKCAKYNRWFVTRRYVNSTTVQFGAWNLPSLRPCRHRIPGATRQEVRPGCHLTMGISDLWILIGYPQPNFQDKIRVIWRLKDSWTKICICRNMCFFCNFTLASHLQRHQLCGSGQWSVLRFVAIHVAEMECLHESSRRGQVGFFNCSI